MPQKVLCLITTMCLLFLPGCYDQLNLEDTSLVLMLGLDVDENNNLILYESSPVFYKEAKEKSEDIEAISTTLTGARDKADAIVTGITLGGKVQTVLISKRLIQQDRNWYAILDTVYREPKQSITSRVLLVDGDMKEIFHFKPKDKPRLSLHMKKLIDTANKRSITVSTNLQEFRHQMKDRGITATISEIKKDKEQIKVTGTSLLTHQGRYATSLNLEESSLLLLMKDKIAGDFSMPVPFEKNITEADQKHPMITIVLKKVKRQVATQYANHTFQFDVHLKISAVVIGTNFPTSLEKRKTQVATQVATVFQKKLTALVEKCQENQIDPIGFGYYARAYQYPAWKTVQDHWGQTFAKSQVHIIPEVEIKSVGVTE